ncbi:unnamed protein product [Orchesella dallaii]|uniref:Gustatory receptor n=1 Tax=Orchesella dallaii TaxID=48710 RepID=A0ABP1RNV3_9HEXA
MVANNAKKSEADIGHEHVVHSRQTQHSKELINAFKPIKYFLTIIGQMPFVIKPKKDGTYSFKFYKCSGQALIYLFMFIVSSTLYLAVTLGIISFILDAVFNYIRPTHTVIVRDKDDGTTDTLLWERYLIRHEMVSMIVVWSWLTVACAGSLYIVTNSKYYVHYMNYFNRVVQIMDMDMTPGVSAYLFFNNVLSLVVAGLLTVGFVAGILFDSNAVTNTAAVISNFIFRLYNIEIEDHIEYKIWFEIMGYCIMIYALFASRANVIQFLFFSQLLKNGSKIWNERLRKVLTHEKIESKDEQDQFNQRLEARLIYKDHLLIVQLYQMTENVFGTILFAYYSLTIISVVMELYQLAALQGFGSAENEKFLGDETDDKVQKAQLYELRLGISSTVDPTQESEILASAGIALLLLCQNVYFCYITTVDAAKAYEYVRN